MRPAAALLLLRVIHSSGAQHGRVLCASTCHFASSPSSLPLWVLSMGWALSWVFLPLSLSRARVAAFAAARSAAVVLLAQSVFYCRCRRRHRTFSVTAASVSLPLPLL